MQMLGVAQDVTPAAALLGGGGTPEGGAPENTTAEEALPFSDLLDQGLITALLGVEPGPTATTELGPRPERTDGAAEDTGQDAETDRVAAEISAIWLATDWAAAEAPAGSGGGRPADEPAAIGALLDGIAAETPAALDGLGQDVVRRDFNVGRFAESFPAGWEALLSEAAAPEASTNEGETRSANQVKGKGELPITPAGAVSAPEAPVLAAAAPAIPAIDPAVPAAPAPVEAASSPEFTKPDKTAADFYLPGSKAKPVKTAASVETAAPLTAADWRQEAAAVRLTAAARPAAGQPVSTPALVVSRMTDLQRTHTVEHLAQAGLQAFAGKEESLTVDLHPPELGRVRITVENQGQQVNATVTVQDSAVRDLLQERGESLRRSLEQAGVKLGELSVEIRQNFGREMQDQQEAREPQAEPAEPKRQPVLAAAGSRGRAAAWRAAGSSRVDLMV